MSRVNVGVFFSSHKYLTDFNETWGSWSLAPTGEHFGRNCTGDKGAGWQNIWIDVKPMLPSSECRSGRSSSLVTHCCVNWNLKLILRSRRRIFHWNCGLLADRHVILVWVSCPAVTFVGCLSPITHVEANYWLVAGYFCCAWGRRRRQQVCAETNRPATISRRRTPRAGRIFIG